LLATQITNHVQAALNRLLQQYKGQPNLAALITAFVDQIQDLEDAVFSLDAGRQLANAVGAQLDGIGQLVGANRNGLSDAEFLLEILGTIASNTSDTTIAKVAAITYIFFNPDSVILDEIFPAAIGLQLGSPTIDPNLFDIAISLLQNALGAGIGIGYVSTYVQDESFCTLGCPAGGKGFTRVGDPPGTGGIFARVVYNNLEV